MSTEGFALDPMTIALIVLVIAGVWAVVELALTLRQTRKSVSELTDSVNETIADIRPVVAKLDGVADELPAAAKQIEPILEKASTTVDLINVDLVRVEGILSAVSGAVESVATGVAGALGKVAGKVSGRTSAKISAPAATGALDAPAPAEPVNVERVSGDEGYFTYPSASAGDVPAEQVPSVSDDASCEAPAEPSAAAEKAE